MSATPASSNPIVLYGFPLSGHVHRVRLFLTLLGVAYNEVTVDLTKGAHQTPEFRARNVFGQVPVIEDRGTTIADSNAILVYLALTYDKARRWLPQDAIAQAHVQRWLSAAAGALNFGPAAARVNVLFGRPQNPDCAVIADRLLATMEAHLKNRSWLAADHATIADLAMYTYTAHASEGGISLETYPLIKQWIERVESLPKFIGMVRTST
jgi:glutathione S-transferase